MKKVGKLYNHCSDSYKTQSSNVIPSSAKIALDQLLAHAKPQGEHDSQEVIDLGVGTGSFLKQYSNMNTQVNFTGVDVSSSMLKIAQDAVSLNGICASIGDVCQYVPENKYNVVIAHFVCSFVGFEKILEQSNYLLAPGGYISVSTTTGESWRYCKENFLDKKTLNPIKYIVKKMIKRTLKNTYLPSDGDDIERMCEKHNYSIVQRSRQAYPLTFSSRKEAVRFGLEDGWFVSMFDTWWFPLFLSKPVAKLFSRVLAYPFMDELVVETVLIKN